jgi:hypothetical protein
LFRSRNPWLADVEAASTKLAFVFTYQSRHARPIATPARTALKNSQLTCGDVTIICETVH